MTTIIIITALLLSVGVLFSTRKNAKDEDGEFNIKWLFKPLAIVIIGFLVAWIQPFKIERVDAGNVGIAVNLAGDERGVANYQYKTGWVVVNSWVQQLYEFPTFQQHVEYEKQNLIAKGGFVIPCGPTFNYSLVSGAIGDMFQNLRLPLKDVEVGWLKTAIVGAANDEANRWEVDSIFSHREEFENSIIKECNKRLSKWFNMSQLRLNMIPPDALVKAINRQVAAVKEAQAEISLAEKAAATQKRLTAEARADSADKVIRAKGLAQAAIETAKGEAEAMRLKQRELSPTYVEYIKWLNWDGKLPSTVTGNGTGILLSK